MYYFYNCMEKLKTYTTIAVFIYVLIFVYTPLYQVLEWFNKSISNEPNKNIEILWFNLYLEPHFSSEALPKNTSFNQKSSDS